MKYYVVDAFADHVFEGNPAGICVIDKWPDEELMQKIAMENNLSETAFAVKKDKKGHYDLRWFTPGGEVDLCGHATLATSYAITHFYETDAEKLTFYTKSGELTVTRKGDLFEMDFPAYALKPVPVTDKMEKAIGYRPLEAWIARDLVCVLENSDQVINTVPDLSAVLELDGLLLHVTAQGGGPDHSDGYDCFSRSFAPKVNVPEDPVCGSGHCHIAPLWAAKLNKTGIVARQASKRGGTLYCEMADERIRLSGKAVLYSTAELHI